MTQTKIQGKFYPLTASIAEALREAKLSAAEWRIWSYLVQLEPFGDRYEDFDYLSVMSICDCSKATLYRTIAKFQELKIFDFQARGLCLKNLIGTSQLRKPETEPDPPKNDSQPKTKPKTKTNERPKTKEPPILRQERPEPTQPPVTNDYPEVSDPWDDLPEPPTSDLEEISSAARQKPPVSSMRTESQICESSLKNENPVSSMRNESQICENEGLKPPSDIQSDSPQTLQSYSDFRRSLSEDERENFFNYVKEQTKNLRQPINDLEAWLASKNAANQNRWEVYYQNYQNHIRLTNPRDNRTSSPSRRQKISQWQEYLRQEKLAAARLQEESRRLQKSKQSQTEHITEQNNSNHNQATSERPENTPHPTPDTPHPTRSEFNQMLNHPQGTTKNTFSATPKPDSSSNRQINRNQGRKILRDLDLRQRLENSQDRDQGGES